MGAIVDAHRLFGQVKFTKKGSEIRTATKRKLGVLRTKLVERAKRIKVIRAQYKIDDAAFAELALKYAQIQQQRMYSSVSNVTVTTKAGDEFREIAVPAGVLMNIMSEREMAENEKQQIERLETMCRNIAPGGQHELSFFELDYLGF
jgi:ABC-type multidrug transport system fused ATPase/permease subunit